MTRWPMAISLLLLVIGLAAAALWGVSYWQRPIVAFPWPTAGLDQHHDRGFLLLASGRVFVIRQRAELTPAIAIQSPEAAKAEDPGAAPAWGLWADTTTLGSMRILRGATLGTPPIAVVAVGPGEDALVGRSWSRLGFTSGVVSAPQVLVNDVLATARITAIGVPLWPFVLALLPAAWLLFRNRRSRRWGAEGRCRACGYDLRESPDRCPECGAPAAPGGACRPRERVGPAEHGCGVAGA